MSVCYSAQIVVGLPRREIINQELIDNGDIDICPPYYDGGGDGHTIAGICYIDSGDYSACEVAWDERKIASIKAKFFELTGQHAKIYISPCSY